MRRHILATAVVVTTVVAACSPSGPAGVPSVAPPTAAPNCTVLPADSIWNTPITDAPVHARSADWIAAIGADDTLHPDFGEGLYDGGPIGIPFTTVPGDQPRVDVSFDYDDESDHPDGGWPIPPDAPIEGGPDSDGDRHILVIDRDACVLYELYAAYPRGDGGWEAGSGAVYDLASNDLRPAGWTSADAAGLPILPGLIRRDEVAAGRIDHAIRFTAANTASSYLWPARHQAGSDNDTLPPMGARLRLRSDLDIAGYPADVRVILEALQTYGMILADNGSSWFLSGVPDEGWDNDVLRAIKDVPGSAFEVVDVSGLQAEPDSGRVAGAFDAAAYRLAGDTRIDTAVAISGEVFSSADAAVLVRADEPPDALAAAALASAVGGPVLLTPSTGLADVVRVELQRLGVTTIHLAGGPAALSAAVAETAGQIAPTVTRHAGEDRYATAAALGKAAVAVWRAAGDTDAGDDVLITLGSHPDPGRAWPDALAAGVLAGHAHRPLLLVTPDGVPPATHQAIEDLGATSATVVGGPSAIPQAVAGSLNVASVTRLAGSDRYTTAAVVAAAAIDAGARADTVVVATGTAFPDGLAAGPAAVARGGVVLLTDGAVASSAVIDHVRAHTIEWLRVAGGPQAVSDDVVRVLVDAVR